MNVTIEKCGDELIAALAGEIDHHNSKQIREAIDAELERGGYKLLTFDLESVSFMDSSGIGIAVFFTHLRAHETVLGFVCRLLFEKKT